MNRMKTIQNEGFNLFPFFLTLVNPIRSNQRKSLKNLRKLLEMSISLSKYTREPA